MKFTNVDKNLIQIYLNSTSEGVFVLDGKKELLYCNSKYRELVGINYQLDSGYIPTTVQNGWHDPIFYKRMWDIVETKGQWDDEVWDTKKDNQALFVVHQKIIKFKDGFKYKYLGIISDVSTNLKNIQKLQYLERVDQNTNLHNRYFGEVRLKEFIKNKRSDVSILLLNINNFSVISQTFGHKQGDSVLKEIAFRLRSISELDNLFSFRIDKFVLYIEYNKILEIEDFAFKLIEAFFEPFNVKGNDFYLSINIGIANYMYNGSSIEELIKNADSAMNEAKNKSSNSFAFYEPQMNEQVVEQFQLVNELRRSLEKRELSIVYQPQIDIEKNKIYGVEALLRWNSSLKGNVAPSIFIPIAEKNGLINAIGAWSMRQICDQIIKWNKNGVKDITVGINISPIQFNDKRLVPLIKNIFYNKVDTSLIEFEITENIFINDLDAAIVTMNSLKELGFKLAIDDFGTGFSSFSYLKKFPIDKLKIDKTFVDNVITDSGDSAIVKSIVNLSENLGLEVISEGIENQEQRDFIESIGCNLIQGYYYSKPINGDEFLEFYKGKNIK